MYACVCTLRTFQGCNYSLLLILSRVMCFHPWSDVTLPLMSIDEILEVIREWIRQFQELSKTYRWVQVVFNLSSLFEWLPDHVNWTAINFSIYFETYLIWSIWLALLFVGQAVCEFFILMLKIINLKLKVELDWQWEFHRLTLHLSVDIWK